MYLTLLTPMCYLTQTITIDHIEIPMRPLSELKDQKLLNLVHSNHLSTKKLYQEPASTAAETKWAVEILDAKYEKADLPKVVQQAKKVSKELLEWVDKGYKVITLTASCGLMLKFEWPLLLPNDEYVKKLSSNVMDIDEYVGDIAKKQGESRIYEESDDILLICIYCFI